VTHEYDSGFLTAIPGFANSLTYHDNLALASVAHSNGVTDWVGQDPDRMMRPAALWTSGVAGEENWNSGNYQFDGSGNIKAIGAQRFRYDAVSRLVEAKIWVPENNPPLNSFDDGFETGDTCNWDVRNAASGCVAGAQQLGLESYTYDPYGNLIARTTETSDGATQLNTPADPQTNRLQGASTYDDEGNMTGWNGADYDFDALGQMVRMRNGNQDWLFAYSTGGERILQLAEGGLGEKRWTVRDATGRVLREWVAPPQGALTWTRDWIYRGTQILATVEPQQQELLDQAEGETSQVVQGALLSGAVEVIRHLTLDHLGTPRLVTDEAGTNLAFHIYWPYGEEASDPLQDELRKKYTGHERDAYDLTSLADELDYMHARFMNSNVARFLAADPLAGGLVTPQSFNRFAYVGGNPVGRIDPDGFCWVSDASGDGPFDCGFGGTTNGTGGADPTGGSAGGAGGGGGGPRWKRPHRTPGGQPPGGGGGGGGNGGGDGDGGDDGNDGEGEITRTECSCRGQQAYSTDAWQNASDFSAGLGDSLLGTFGDEIRDAVAPATVNRDSPWYQAGSWATAAFGAGRLLYAGLAKGFSIYASSGATASLARTRLKNLFGAGLTKNWRVPDLAGKSDDALRASAGRTNPVANSAGAAYLASGLANGAGTCPCPQQ
jgi:RHS repeat-associated protein